jgi:YidC/Oxa1 family membrane protein insertase
MENNRNFLITIALSVLILTLWQVFYMNPRIEAQKEAARIEAERVEQEKKDQTPAPAPGGTDVAMPPQGGVPGTAPGTDGAAPGGRDQALAASQRIKIDTPSLSGSINLTGARIDDLRLKEYHLTVDKNSPTIELLNPSGLPNGYFAEVGFLGNDATGAVPGADTVWTVEGTPTLTPSAPVTLTYTNDKGLTFKRAIAVDADYMFTVTDTVTNGGGAPVSLSSYGRVTRFDKPTHASIYVLHEGLIGYTAEDKLQEIKYSTIEEEKQNSPAKSTSGWLGITDKYWAVALVPSGKEAFQPRFAYFADGRPRYQADYLADPVRAGRPVGDRRNPGVRRRQGSRDDRRLRGRPRHPQFDKLIDWGWFYFITKPMFWLIDWLYKLLGNFGLAILAVTVIVKRCSSRSPTSPTSRWRR